MTDILVCGEIDGEHLSEQTAKTVTAALAFGAEADLLLIGDNISDAAENARKLTGVRKVLKAEAPHFKGCPAENAAALLTALSENYAVIIAPSTTCWKNIIPRFAATQDNQPVTDVIAVLDRQTFRRPIYAGNAVTTVKAPAGKLILTVRPTAFSATGSTGSAVIEILSLPPASENGARFIREETVVSERPSLTAAKIVVSGGRGVGSKEAFEKVIAFADHLKAAVGASRAAVDSGFAPNDWQVGQTGKIVAPGLYVALGISGAAQHLAGMKDSRVTVAVNKDPDAPIFSVADYGIVKDLFDFMPEFTAELDKIKG